MTKGFHSHMCYIFIICDIYKKFLYYYGVINTVFCFVLVNRGALIVFEGCDRSGKTTQCKKLVEALKMLNIPAEYMNFPSKQ